MARIECDKTLCSGCLACVVACMDQHYDETEVEAVSPRIYEERVAESGLTNYVTRSCMHCEDAPCVTACPLQVLEKDEQGFVVVAHQRRCIGCKRCVAVCPHDVPRFNKDMKIVKCDGCAVRVAHGLQPACVRACNTGALELIRESVVWEIEND